MGGCIDNPGGGAAAAAVVDASTSAKGVTKLATAPAVADDPIAAGTNDPRLSDSRTPTAHASSHAAAGSDPVTLTQAQITGLVADLAAKAPLASPALTGNPTAPTPAQGDNDTSIATTAYVQTAAGLLIPKSLVDAKGDLIVGTADDVVARLPVGPDKSFLQADSAAASGLTWRKRSYVEDFSVNNLANYTYIAAAAAQFTVAGGVLTIPGSVGDKEFLIPDVGDIADGRALLKWRTSVRAGAGQAAQVGITVRSDTNPRASNTALQAFVNWDGTNTFLFIQKRTAGAGANLVASISLGPLANATDYWLQAIWHGNYFAAEHFTVNPENNPAAVPGTRVESTISSTAIHPHGAGADSKKCGLNCWGNGTGTTYVVDDLTFKRLV